MHSRLLLTPEKRFPRRILRVTWILWQQPMPKPGNLKMQLERKKKRSLS